MGKKLISLALATVLMIAVATTAFAAPVNVRSETGGYGYGGCGGYGYSLMRNADGSFLTKEAFEANLDQAIADGYILESNRQYYVDMFDYCVANGGIGRGGCGGRGLGRR